MITIYIVFIILYPTIFFPLSYYPLILLLTSLSPSSPKPKNPPPCLISSLLLSSSHSYFPLNYFDPISYFSIFSAFSLSYLILYLHLSFLNILPSLSLLSSNLHNLLYFLLSFVFASHRHFT